MKMTISATWLRS